jgi:MFS family permease
MRTYVLVLSLASVGVTLAVQAASPALPAIQSALGIDDADIGWFTTAYVLPGVLLTVPMGILADKIGRRLLFCVALCVYGAAALVQAAASSYSLLLMMRVLQGASFAAAMPLTITFIGERFRGKERLNAVAGRNAILTASEVVLPLAGAFLAAVTWRATLAVQAVTIPLAISSFLILEEHQSAPERRSYIRDLSSVLRSQHGMFAVLMTGFIRFIFKFVIYAYLPILLVNKRGASITQAGIVVSISALVAAITATRVPSTIRSIRPSTALISAVILLAGGTAALGVAPDWVWALPAAAVYGVGDGVLSVLQDTYVIHVAQAHVAAGIVSVSQTARNFGKFVAPLAMTVLVAITSLEVAFFTMAFVGTALVPLFLPLRTLDFDFHSPDADTTTNGLRAATVDNEDPLE